MKFALKQPLLVATSLLLTMGLASAADLGSPPASDLGNLEAFKNFQVKAGFTGVIWDDKNHGVFNNGTLVPGSDAHVRDVVLPSVTLTYFFDKHFAAELFCCFAHANVRGEGTIQSLGRVADTWAFPPILTAQYHFDRIGLFRPYVGAGVEYIHYFNSKSDISGVASAKFRDSWGPALQAGVDLELGRGWSLGLDAKYVWEDTRITWSNGFSTRHDLDPLLLTGNVGYRFNLEDLLSRHAPAPTPVSLK